MGWDKEEELFEIATRANRNSGIWSDRKKDFKEFAESDFDYRFLDDDDKKTVREYFDDYDAYEFIFEERFEEEREKREKERERERERLEEIRGELHLQYMRQLEVYNCCKYESLGAETKEQREFVDMFDRVVDTPSFARLYKIKTGNELPPVSQYRIGEFEDYKYNSNFNESIRKEVFEKSSVYLNDGSYDLYLNTSKMVPDLKKSLEVFINYKCAESNGGQCFDDMIEEIGNIYDRKLIHLEEKSILVSLKRLDNRQYIYKLSYALVAVFIIVISNSDNVLFIALSAVIAAVLAFLTFFILTKRKDNEYNSEYFEQNYTPSNFFEISKQKDITNCYNPFAAADLAFEPVNFKECKELGVEICQDLFDGINDSIDAFKSNLEERLFYYEKRIKYDHEYRIKYIKKNYLLAYIISLFVFTIIVLIAKMWL